MPPVLNCWVDEVAPASNTMLPEPVNSARIFGAVYAVSLEPDAVKPGYVSVWPGTREYGCAGVDKTSCGRPVREPPESCRENCDKLLAFPLDGVPGGLMRLEILPTVSVVVMLLPRTNVTELSVPRLALNCGNETVVDQFVWLEDRVGGLIA